MASAAKMIGVALIAAGALALAYGGFSYTQEVHQAKLGPLELSVKDTKTVNIPIWGSVVALVIGGALLVFGGRTR